MAHQHAAELPHIGEALVSIRAAVDVVREGAATRVTVHAEAGEQILPAARALARASGVAIEPVWWADGVGLRHRHQRRSGRRPSMTPEPKPGRIDPFLEVREKRAGPPPG